jgi:hypothetical protein
LLENIALVEAKYTKAVTGLNQNHIRFRREKPVYKFYLEKARKELARAIGQDSPPRRYKNC